PLEVLYSIPTQRTSDIKDKWYYADLSKLEHKITNEVFKEGNNFYMGTDKESIMRLSSDFEPIWEDKNSYGYKVSFAIDEDHIYNAEEHTCERQPLSDIQ